MPESRTRTAVSMSWCGSNQRTIGRRTNPRSDATDGRDGHGGGPSARSASVSAMLDILPPPGTDHASDVAGHEIEKDSYRNPCRHARAPEPLGTLSRATLLKLPATGPQPVCAGPIKAPSHTIAQVSSRMRTATNRDATRTVPSSARAAKRTGKRRVGSL